MENDKYTTNFELVYKTEDGKITYEEPRGSYWVAKVRVIRNDGKEVSRDQFVKDEDWEFVK